MGLSARELGLKAAKTRKNLAIFYRIDDQRIRRTPEPLPPALLSPRDPPINCRTVVHGRLLGVLDAGPRMGNSRGPPDAREWHFRALGALASHSPRHGRPRLERPLLDAIGADPRASKPAGLSTAAPKSGALRALCPRAAGASQARFRSGPPSWRTARATAARASRAAARRLRGPAAQDKAHRAARWRADARLAGEHRVREPPARARPAFGPGRSGGAQPRNRSSRFTGR